MQRPVFSKIYPRFTVKAPCAAFAIDSFIQTNYVKAMSLFCYESRHYSRILSQRRTYVIDFCVDDRKTGLNQTRNCRHKAANDEKTHFWFIGR